MSRLRSNTPLLIRRALQSYQLPLPRPRRNHTTATTTSSSSVDPTEISHFNALASTWWDPQGPSRLLHQMNPLRHDFIQSCLSNTYPHSSLRYLDVGCGGGIFTESAARLPRTAKVVGLDPSGDVLAVARRHARQDPLLARHLQEGKLAYVQSSVEAFPRPESVEGLFDVLTLFEVVEHVSHPALFLEACLPLVRPGGWLVLSTIARTWTSWVTTKLVAEDLLRLVPRGTHDWAKYVNEEELRAWFAKRDGWGRTRCMGVAYVPGLGWKELPRGERVGNYFFGVRKNDRD